MFLLKNILGAKPEDKVNLLFDGCQFFSVHACGSGCHLCPCDALDNLLRHRMRRISNRGVYKTEDFLPAAQVGTPVHVCCCDLDLLG